jgi:hypothetical protein
MTQVRDAVVISTVMTREQRDELERRAVRRSRAPGRHGRKHAPRTSRLWASCSSTRQQASPIGASQVIPRSVEPPGRTLTPGSSYDDAGDGLVFLRADGNPAPWSRLCRARSGAVEQHPTRRCRGEQGHPPPARSGTAATTRASSGGGVTSRWSGSSRPLPRGHCRTRRHAHRVISGSPCASRRSSVVCGRRRSMRRSRSTSAFGRSVVPVEAMECGEVLRGDVSGAYVSRRPRATCTMTKSAVTIATVAKTMVMGHLLPPTIERAVHGRVGDATD